MKHKKKPMQSLKKQMKEHISGEKSMDKKVVKQDKKMLGKMGKKGC